MPPVRAEAPSASAAPESTSAVDLIKNARAALARGSQPSAPVTTMSTPPVVPVPTSASVPASAPAPMPEPTRLPTQDVPPWEELPDSAYDLMPMPELDPYQKMMPEPMPVVVEPTVVPAPISEPQVQPQIEVDQAIPDNITPMVSPCPTELLDNQHWVMLFDHLPLRGFERTIADNAALQARKDSVLVFGISENVRNFINPARIEEWQRALQQVLQTHFTIEIVPLQPNMDTPSQRKERLIALRKQQAEQLFMQDDNIQRLINEFDAEVNFASIQPLI